MGVKVINRSQLSKPNSTGPGPEQIDNSSPDYNENGSQPTPKNANVKITNFKADKNKSASPQQRIYETKGKLQDHIKKTFDKKKKGKRVGT